MRTARGWRRYPWCRTRTARGPRGCRSSTSPSSSACRSSRPSRSSCGSADGRRRRPRPRRANPVLVETSGLTKVFGEIRAVDDLSVAIPDGTIGLVGPNGAGKTTFLRLLLGLLRPTAGTARVLGHGIDDGVAVRERICCMPEHGCLFPDLAGLGLVSYMG